MSSTPAIKCCISWHWKAAQLAALYGDGWNLAFAELARCMAKWRVLCSESWDTKASQLRASSPLTVALRSRTRSNLVSCRAQPTRLQGSGLCQGPLARPGIQVLPAKHLPQLHRGLPGIMCGRQATRQACLQCMGCPHCCLDCDWEQASHQQPGPVSQPACRAWHSQPHSGSPVAVISSFNLLCSMLRFMSVRGSSANASKLPQ